MNIPEITVSLLKDIPYFITGSRRFGTSHDLSDLDICVSIVSYSYIKSDIITLGKNLTHSAYNNGFKFEDGGLIINIIPLHPADYVSWFHAAIMMESMPNLKNLLRQQIHGYYQMLCSMVKLAYGDVIINTENMLTLCGLELPEENNKQDGDLPF